MKHGTRAGEALISVPPGANMLQAPGGKDLGFRVWGLWFEGLGFRVWGL